MSWIGTFFDCPGPKFALKFHNSWNWFLIISSPIMSVFQSAVGIEESMNDASAVCIRSHSLYFDPEELQKFGGPEPHLFLTGMQGPVKVGRGRGPSVSVPPSFNHAQAPPSFSFLILNLSKLGGHGPLAPPIHTPLLERRPAVKLGNLW